MRPSSWFIATAIAIQALASTASALPEPHVSNLQLEGDGCSGAGGELAEDASGQWSYTLVFPDLAVTSSGRSMSSCAAQIEVAPPRGFRLRISKVIVEGTHMTPPGAHTEVLGRYELDQGMPMAMPMEFIVEPSRQVRVAMDDMLRVSQTDGIGSSAGNWGVVIDETMQQWTDCNVDGASRPVQLRGGLQLRATSSSIAPDAELAVQRSDVGMMWAWWLESCHGAEPFAGEWSSTYMAPNGHQIPATIRVQGTSGSYQTPHFTGQLRDIRVQGGVVRGRWSVGLLGGSFAFRLDGSGSFDGQWAFGHPGSPGGGRWWGQRRAR